MDPDELAATLVRMAEQGRASSSSTPTAGWPHRARGSSNNTPAGVAVHGGRLARAPSASPDLFCGSSNGDSPASSDAPDEVDEVEEAGNHVVGASGPGQSTHGDNDEDDEDELLWGGPVSPQKSPETTMHAQRAANMRTASRARNESDPPFWVDVPPLAPEQRRLFDFATIDVEAAVPADANDETRSRWFDPERRKKAEQSRKQRADPALRAVRAQVRSSQPINITDSDSSSDSNDVLDSIKAKLRSIPTVPTEKWGSPEPTAPAEGKERPNADTELTFEELFIQHLTSSDEDDGPPQPPAGRPEAPAKNKAAPAATVASRAPAGNRANGTAGPSTQRVFPASLKAPLPSVPLKLPAKMHPPTGMVLSKEDYAKEDRKRAPHKQKADKEGKAKKSADVGRKRRRDSESDGSGSSGEGGRTETNGKRSVKAGYTSRSNVTPASPPAVPLKRFTIRRENFHPASDSHRGVRGDGELDDFIVDDDDEYAVEVQRQRPPRKLFRRRESDVEDDGPRAMGPSDYVRLERQRMNEESLTMSLDDAYWWELIWLQLHQLDVKLPPEDLRKASHARKMLGARMDDGQRSLSTMAKRKNFLWYLKTYPKLIRQTLTTDEVEARKNSFGYGCGFCRRTKQLPESRMYLYGRPYGPELTPRDKAEISSSDCDTDQDDDVKERHYDVVPGAGKGKKNYVVFYLGSKCAVRAELMHRMMHWEVYAQDEVRKLCGDAVAGLVDEPYREIINAVQRVANDKHRVLQNFCERMRTEAMNFDRGLY